MAVSAVYAQNLAETDTLKLDRKQAEAMFLKNNLQLLAEKLEIAQAEAAIIQAKAWPNPSLDISEVNLWAGPGQREYFGELLPPFWGNFGRNQQLGLELSHLIQTARKRKKLIAIENVGRDMAEQYLEDLLRNLKLTFRHQLSQLQFQQSYARTFSNQLNSIDLLLRAYQHQISAGNIPKSEYIRLRAERLEVAQRFAEVQKDLHASQSNLRVLMGIAPEHHLLLDEEDLVPDEDRLDQLMAVNVLEAALQNRPDLKASHLASHYAEKELVWEKAQRVPDLELNMNYDRGGNFMMDFIGFGLSIDLPVFDRNQGNIKKATHELEQQQLLTQHKSLEVQSEAQLAYQNLQTSLNFYQSIEAEYESELDAMLESYTRNFSQRNISLLEYLDFLNAYLENKQSILEAKADLNQAFEELQFTIGTEIQ